MIKLKFVSFLLLVGLLFIQCSTSTKIVGDDKSPKYTINETNIENINVKDGDVVAFQIEIQNIGQKPLKIEGVRTNCGCLIPEWSNKAIRTNEKSEVILNFYSKSKGINEGNELTYKVFIAMNGKEEIVEIRAKVFSK